MDARDAAAQGGERSDAAQGGKPSVRRAVPGGARVGRAGCACGRGSRRSRRGSNLLLCFEGLLRDQVAYGGGVIHDPLFLAATLAAALLLLASPRMGRCGSRRRRAARRGAAEAGRRRERRKARQDAFRRGGWPCWSVAGAARWRGRRGPERGRRSRTPCRSAWLAAAAGLAAGAFIARFTLWWGSVVSSFDMREVLASLCFAFCVQWLPFIAVVSAGAVGKTVLAAALPLCSGWCLRGFEAAGGVPRMCCTDAPAWTRGCGKDRRRRGALRARCSAFRSSSSSCGPSTWP